MPEKWTRRDWNAEIAASVLAARGVVGWAAPGAVRVTAVPEEARRRLKLASFYAKHVDLHGFSIVASAKVRDDAILEAARIVDAMLVHRRDLLEAMTSNKVRLAVMAESEQTTDIPEHADLTPKKYWDGRARGLGPTHARPAVSCAEENLLHLSGDRYPNESILIHEFAHAIHLMGLDRVDPTFSMRLKACYDEALRAGKWAKTYAATNAEEYWAEGVQSYFDSNNPPNHDHNDINTREKLSAYDEGLFALIDATFRRPAWRYGFPKKRGRP